MIALPSCATSQSSPLGLAACRTVRVAIAGDTVSVGTVIALRGDTLEYAPTRASISDRPDPARQETCARPSSGQSVRVLLGPNVLVSVPGGTDRHAGIGAAIGGMIPIGGIILAPIGGLIGAAVRTERWIPAGVPGRRVRLTMPATGRQIGVIRTVGKDSVAFVEDGGTAHSAILTRSEMLLEVSDGIHANAAKGALIGFALGTIVGVGVTAAELLSAGGGVCEFCGLSGLIAVSAGDAIGLIVGSQVRTERWIPVSVPRAGPAAVRGDSKLSAPYDFAPWIGVDASGPSNRTARLPRFLVGVRLSSAVHRER